MHSDCAPIIRRDFGEAFFQTLCLRSGHLLLLNMGLGTRLVHIRLHTGSVNTIRLCNRGNFLVNCQNRTPYPFLELIGGVNCGGVVVTSNYLF